MRHLVYFINKLLLSSNSTCQKPLLTSKVEKTFALPSSGKISSIVVNWKLGRFKALLSGIGSMQMRKESGFFIRRILLTQSV